MVDWCIGGQLFPDRRTPDPQTSTVANTSGLIEAVDNFGGLLTGVNTIRRIFFTLYFGRICLNFAWQSWKFIASKSHSHLSIWFYFALEYKLEF